jgi:hypothetical protein
MTLRERAIEHNIFKKEKIKQIEVLMADPKRTVLPGGNKGKGNAGPTSIQCGEKSAAFTPGEDLPVRSLSNPKPEDLDNTGDWRSGPDGFWSEVRSSNRMKPSNANDRIEALRKREQAIKAAIAEEQVRQHKRKEKDRARLAAIVGEVLLDRAARVADFDAMLRQILKTADMEDRSRQFLMSMGWV